MQSIVLKSMLFFVFFPVLSFSAVWNTSNYWDAQWEQKYSDWMKLSVQRDIFKNEQSKWNGTRTDCADAAYAMRIIFSYENGLPFQMKNPSGSRLSGEGEAVAKFLTNETPAFDRYEEGVKRVIRFIEYIGDSVGTEHLAYHDTYATTVQSINPGHVYIYQYASGRTRHTYVVKDRLIDGNLILFSSTVPKAPRKLAKKRGMPASFSGRPWGFKKFKQPEFYNPEYVYTEETNASKEQYEILKKVGKSKIMSSIKKMLQFEDENLVDSLTKYSENACSAMKDRQEVIEVTQDFLNRKSGRCMTEAEYHDYSTPGRDKGIVDSLDTLISAWENVVETGRSNEFPVELVKAYNYLSGFSKKVGRDELNQLCTVSFQVKGKSYSLNLKDFRDRYNKTSLFGRRRLSPYPNDPILLRWGLKAKKSKCKRF